MVTFKPEERTCALVVYLQQRAGAEGFIALMMLNFIAIFAARYIFGAGWIATPLHTPRELDISLTIVRIGDCWSCLPTL